MAGHYSPNAPRFATPRAKLNGDWTGEGVDVPTNLDDELVPMEEAVLQAYRIAYTVMERLIPKYPRLTSEFSREAEPWACKFMFYSSKHKLFDSLDTDDTETGRSLNPDVIRIVQGSTASELKRNIAGEVKHWLEDFSDKTEYGRTMRVLEHDMELRKDIFVNIRETRCWALVDGKKPTSSCTLNDLRKIMAEDEKEHPLDLPSKEKFEKFRQGKMKRRPSIKREPMQALLQRTLRAADGAVEINDLTTALTDLHPELVGGNTSDSVVAKNKLQQGIVSGDTLQALGMSSDDMVSQSPMDILLEEESMGKWSIR